jgi:hypothetical protein
MQERDSNSGSAGHDSSEGLRNELMLLQSDAERSITEVGIHLSQEENHALDSVVGDLRGLTRLRDDEDREQEVSQEVKESLELHVRSLFASNRAHNKALYRVCRAVYEAHQAMKPLGLFLSCLTLAKLPIKTAYLYLAIYEAFREELVFHASLGVRKLAVLSKAENRMDIIRTHGIERLERMSSERIKNLVGRAASSHNSHTSRDKSVPWIIVTLSKDRSTLTVRNLSDEQQPALANHVIEWLSEQGLEDQTNVVTRCKSDTAETPLENLEKSPLSQEDAGSSSEACPVTISERSANGTNREEGRYRSCFVHKRGYQGLGYRKDACET